MQDSDTSMGEGRRRFPTTLWSEILAFRATDRPGWSKKLERLAARYWHPIYLHIRIRWRKSNEDAKDLTQEFFAKLLEGDVLPSCDPSRGRFRSYVHAVLNNFLREDATAARREKRGGDRPLLRLDSESCRAAEELVGEEVAPEEVFDRAWRREVLEEAFSRLETLADRHGVPHAAEALRRYYWCPGRVTYGSVAREMGFSTFDVTNLLQRARSWLRDLVIQVLRETVVDPEGLAAELEELFGRTEVPRRA